MNDFSTIAERLRNHPDCDYGVGAREEQIVLAEKALDIQFPSSYRQFLREFGWCSIGFREIFGLGDDVPSWLDVAYVTESERREMRPPLPKDLLPVFNDGGGNLACINTAAGSVDIGAMVFWDHDKDADQTPEVLEPNFVTWLESLL